MRRKYEKALELLTKAIKEGTNPRLDQLNMSKDWILKELKKKIWSDEDRFGDEWILQGILKDLE